MWNRCTCCLRKAEFSFTATLRFDKAVTECKDRKSHLATPRSAQERRCIHELIRGRDNVWIGFKMLNYTMKRLTYVEGRKKWLPLRKNYYANFTTNEQFINKKRLCYAAAMPRRNESNLTSLSSWQGFPCQTKFSGICERLVAETGMHQGSMKLALQMIFYMAGVVIIVFVSVVVCILKRKGKQSSPQREHLPVQSVQQGYAMAGLRQSLQSDERNNRSTVNRDDLSVDCPPPIPPRTADMWSLEEQQDQFTSCASHEIELYLTVPVIDMYKVPCSSTKETSDDLSREDAHIYDLPIDNGMYNSTIRYGCSSAFLRVPKEDDCQCANPTVLSTACVQSEDVYRDEVTKDEQKSGDS